MRRPFFAWCPKGDREETCFRDKNAKFGIWRRVLAQMEHLVGTKTLGVRFVETVTPILASGGERFAQIEHLVGPKRWECGSWRQECHFGALRRFLAQIDHFGGDENDGRAFRGDGNAILGALRRVLTQIDHLVGMKTMGVHFVETGRPFLAP